MQLADIHTAVRRSVPAPVKGGYRALEWRVVLFRLWLRARRRRATMVEAVEALRGLEDRAPVPRVVLSRFFYGWANEDYAAEPEFLAAVVDAARRACGPILECGCGLSTLVLGIEAEKRGLEVYSLEHDSSWAKRTKRAVEHHGIRSVTIIVARLRSYGAFIWYDPPRSELPSAFSLVVCDGPPHTTRGGRYGLLPVLYGHLETDCEILLDDVGRDEDRRTLDRWESEFGLRSTIQGVAKPFARLHLSPPSNALRVSGKSPRPIS
jgi:hypothetical protein